MVRCLSEQRIWCPVSTKCQVTSKLNYFYSSPIIHSGLGCEKCIIYHNDTELTIILGERPATPGIHMIKKNYLPNLYYNFFSNCPFAQLVVYLLCVTGQWEMSSPNLMFCLKQRINNPTTTEHLLQTIWVIHLPLSPPPHNLGDPSATITPTPLATHQPLPRPPGHLFTVLYDTLYQISKIFKVMRYKFSMI